MEFGARRDGGDAKQRRGARLPIFSDRSRPLEARARWIEGFQGGLPELPAIRARRFIEQYGLPEYDAAALTASKDMADYFEAAIQLFKQPKTVSNWVMGELTRELNNSGTTIAGSRFLLSVSSVIGDGGEELRSA